MAIELIGPSPLIWKPKETIWVIGGSAPNFIGAPRGKTYSAEQESGVRTSSDITDMGAIVETYDPEWTAWLAGDV